MPGYQQEEEILGKAFDARLMRRLLRYARRYTWAFVACILMLFVVAAGDIARPYLIKLAIDNHINAFDAPMVAFRPGEEPVRGILIDGKVLVRESPGKGITGSDRYQIVEDNRKYALINSVIPRGQERHIIEKRGTSYVESEGHIYPARILSRDEIASFRRNDVRAVVALAFILLAIMIGGLLLNYAQTYLLSLTGQRIIFDMRQELFNHLQHMSTSFFDKNPVGRLVTRVTNDMEALNEMYTGVLVYLFKDIFLLAGAVLTMARLNFRLSLVSFVSIPVIFLMTYIFRIKARTAYRQVRVRLARINATLAENLAGMKVIQVFNQEENKFREFKEINASYYDASMKELQIISIFRPSMELLSSLILALLIWYGGGLAISQTIQFGVLYAFANYVMQFFQPINDMTEKYNVMQSAMAAAERIFMLLDNKEIEEETGSKAPETFRISGEVEFKNVWFAYKGEDWVLKDISFHVKPGQTVAFVGATGAGKTSIISLLTRLYEPQKGQILVDGVDIRDIKRSELRRQISVVMQDVFLFSGDIKSNIRLNDKEIPDEKIRAAAEYVHAHDFIQQLPNGYNEEVTERGSTLSAGQRQLLAFARAIVRDPAILVLDEATATIDTETEALIQDALRRISSGRTTLVIAHRLSTVRDADRIIVLHKGRIREVGTHHELLEKKGIYYQLYLLQFKNGSEPFPSADRKPAAEEKDMRLIAGERVEGAGLVERCAKVGKSGSTKRCALEVTSSRG